MLERPLQLPCGTRLANRIAKAALTEEMADARDRASPRLCTLYERWSRGGADLLITGNAMVDRRHLERPGNVVVDGDIGNEHLREWAHAGTAGGNQFWMQISHPERQCHRASDHRPVAPSEAALRLGPIFRKPRALAGAEIREIIQRYANAAACAKAAGFTGVQIHAAHGYLISQFLSPRVNRRQDEWGGSLEGRARFLLEIVRTVRERVGGDFPVSVKLNSSDFQKGGFTNEECRQVAVWLERARIDLLEISGGTYEQPQLLGHDGLRDTAAAPKRESTRRREGYFLDYARRIRETVTLPLMATGGFRSREAMESAVETGGADVIGLGRPFCVDTDLAQGLFSGKIVALPRHEDRLPLGKTFSGPTSPLRMMQIINVQGEVACFYRQMLRLADGGEPDLSQSLLSALAQHVRDEWRRWGRRRAMARANPDR